MHRIALTLLLTASAACAQAQTCPVHLYAQRQSQPVLQTASEAAKQDQSQGIHVTIADTGIRAIQSIEATLHGLSPDAQVLPVAAHPARDLTQTFHLERETGQTSLTSFNLWMNQAGILRWVDVTSITYADGTTWHTPQPSLCRATPSPFTLVATTP